MFSFGKFFGINKSKRVARPTPSGSTRRNSRNERELAEQLDRMQLASRQVANVRDAIKARGLKQKQIKDLTDKLLKENLHVLMSNFVREYVRRTGENPNKVLIREKTKELLQSEKLRILYELTNYRDRDIREIKEMLDTLRYNVSPNNGPVRGNHNANTRRGINNILKGFNSNKGINNMLKAMNNDPMFKGSMRGNRRNNMNLTPEELRELDEIAATANSGRNLTPEEMNAVERLNVEKFLANPSRK
jgi:hypothetical protein